MGGSSTCANAGATPAWTREQKGIGQSGALARVIEYLPVTEIAARPERDVAGADAAEGESDLIDIPRGILQCAALPLGSIRMDKQNSGAPADSITCYIPVLIKELPISGNSYQHLSY
jgi:hypothetical protein